MRNKIIPPVYFLVGLLLIVILSVTLINFVLFNLYLILLGILLMLLGFYITGKARESLKKHQTTLASNTSSSKLVTEGFYGFTRNPMYLGMFLFLLGVSICLGNFLAVIVSILFLVVMNSLIVPFEERKMEETFGDEYKNYKMRVRRWI